MQTALLLEEHSFGMVAFDDLVSPGLSRAFLPESETSIIFDHTPNSARQTFAQEFRTIAAGFESILACPIDDDDGEKLFSDTSVRAGKAFKRLANQRLITWPTDWLWPEGAVSAGAEGLALVPICPAWMWRHAWFGVQQALALAFPDHLPDNPWCFYVNESVPEVLETTLADWRRRVAGSAAICRWIADQLDNAQEARGSIGSSASEGNEKSHSAEKCDLRLKTLDDCQVTILHCLKQADGRYLTLGKISAASKLEQYNTRTLPKDKRITMYSSKTIGERIKPLIVIGYVEAHELRNNGFRLTKAGEEKILF
jgi:hypothetical protein